MRRLFLFAILSVGIVGGLVSGPSIWAAVEPPITITMDPGQTTKPIQIKDNLGNEVFSVDTDGTIFPASSGGTVSLVTNDAVLDNNAKAYIDVGEHFYGSFLVPNFNFHITETSEPTSLTPTILTLMLQNLSDTVVSMNLQTGIEKSLTSNLDSSIKKLTDDNPSNDYAVCEQLNSFENKVNVQDKKKLSIEQAEILEGLVSNIKSVIGCA